MRRLTLSIFAVVSAAAFAVAGLSATEAQAGFTLGLASNYTILVEPGAHSVQTSNGTINGNIGIGATTAGNPTPANLQNTSGTINGNVDFANATGTVQNPITGTVSHNVSNVTLAINTVNSLASTLGSEGGTSLIINIPNGGDQTINATSGALDGSGNRVFTVSGGLDLNSNSDTHGLTINGTASDFVVINFSQLSNLNGAIILAGGITTDNVLFNYTGGGNFTASSNHHTLSGDFLAVGVKVTWNSVTLQGRLFGGADGQDFQMNSGFNAEQPQQPLVPEPSTMVGAFSGLAAIACVGLFRHRRRPRAIANSV
jgi:hypothetical protein